MARKPRPSEVIGGAVRRNCVQFGLVENNAQPLSSFPDPAFDLGHAPAMMLRAHIDDPAAVDDIIGTIEHATFGQTLPCGIIGKDIVRRAAHDPRLQTRHRVIIEHTAERARCKHIAWSIEDSVRTDKLRAKPGSKRCGARRIDIRHHKANAGACKEFA